MTPHVTLRKAVDAFERMYWVRDAHRVHALDSRSLKIEQAGFYRDPDVARAALLLERVFGTPTRLHEAAKAAVWLGGFAGTGLLALAVKALHDRASEDRRLAPMDGWLQTYHLTRREALRSGLGWPMLIAAVTQESCGGGGGGGSPSAPTPAASPTPVPTPTPVAATFTTALPDLIAGINVGSGTVQLQQQSVTLEVRDGMTLAPAEKNLRTGTDTAIVTTSRGYTRRTPVTINTAGILCDLGDGRQRPLDVLGLDANTGFSYPGYQKVGFQGGISCRANAALEGVLIRGVYHGEQGQTRLVNPGADPAFERSVETVVTQDFPVFSGGFFSGTFKIEQAPPVLDPKRAGAITYYLLDNAAFVIEQAWNGELNGGVVTWAFLGCRAGTDWAQGISAIRNDTGQAFGFIDQADGYAPLDRAGAVTREAQIWSIIKYGRKVGHNSSGYPDNQS